jgi:hypothetical protein
VHHMVSGPFSTVSRVEVVNEKLTYTTANDYVVDSAKLIDDVVMLLQAHDGFCFVIFIKSPILGRRN